MPAKSTAIIAMNANERENFKVQYVTSNVEQMDTFIPPVDHQTG